MNENIDDHWRDFYREVRDDRAFLADKAWETIKFHILLSSSLISITVGALVAMHTSKIFLQLEVVRKAVLTLSLLILPIIMSLILRVGERNFNRGCRRIYEQTAIMIKLEERFGFYGKRREKKPDREKFQEEETYVPSRYFERTWVDTKSFIDDMLTCPKDNFYCNMNPIFRIFRRVSFVLMILIISVVFLHVLYPEIIVSVNS